MKAKIIIAVIISIISALTVLYFLLFRHNTDIKDIGSLLRLPIEESQIVSKEILVTEDNSTRLTLIVDHEFSVASSPFDISLYEGRRLYSELAALIFENGMCIENAIIRVYYIEQRVKEGLFSELVKPQSVYIITGRGNYTIVYTYIPEGVVLPREYR